MIKIAANPCRERIEVALSVQFSKKKQGSAKGLKDILYEDEL
jgi:hypothetical protein